MRYIVHLHNHAGWRTHKVDAESIEDAICVSLKPTAAFLEREYKGKYKIECDNPDDEYPRYRIIWDSDELKHFILGDSLSRGSVWWSDRFYVGEEDDCESCGGTGVSHYNPFTQCWSCGENGVEGKGTGKRHMMTDKVNETKGEKL